MFEIKYPNGCMKINQENFFPSTNGKIKKLLKIIDMDWEHKDVIRLEIREWMKAEIELCNRLEKEYAIKYADARTVRVEKEPGLEAAEYRFSKLRKTDPGYTSLREELQDLRKQYRYLKSLENSYLSSFNSYRSRKEKLQKNLEVLA